MDALRETLLTYASSTDARAAAAAVVWICLALVVGAVFVREVIHALVGAYRFVAAALEVLKAPLRAAIHAASLLACAGALYVCAVHAFDAALRVTHRDAPDWLPYALEYASVRGAFDATSRAVTAVINAAAAAPRL